MGYIDPWQIPTPMLTRPSREKPETPKSDESAEKAAQAADSKNLSAAQAALRLHRPLK